MDGVAAVVVGNGEQLDQAANAVSSQVGRPELVLRAGDPGSRDAAILAAARLDVSFVWVLDGAAVPAADALHRLVHVAQDHVLVVGLVVDGDGRVVRQALGRGSEAATDALVSGAPNGLVPLRNDTLAHTLVRVEAVRRHGPPSSAHFGHNAAMVWTARLLAGGTGILNTHATARALTPLRSERASVRSTVRTARAGVWTPGETVRAASLLIGWR